MNFGITTSFVIGGIFLLSILAFNMSMNSNTQETTLTTINQQKLDNLVDVLSHDFNRLGYNDTDTTGYSNGTGIIDFNPIVQSDDESIDFYISQTSRVRWFALNSDEVTATSNPNDYYLYRVDENGDTYRFPVTNFEIKYYIQNNSGVWEEQTNPGSFTEFTSIKIEVELLMESAEPIRSNYDSGNESYHRTAWKRAFVPTNVNLKQWQ